VKKILEKLFSDFITGIFALLPFVITYWIIIELYKLSKNSFVYMQSYFNDTASTITVMIFIFLFIAGMGKLVKSKTKSIVLNLQEKVLEKIPFINKVYSFIKEIFQLFTSKDEDKKVEVCIVKFGGQNSLGFINNKNGDIYTIFVPTSPNPTNGFNIFVNKNEIKILKGVEKEDALANIVSLGVRETTELKEELSKL